MRHSAQNRFDHEPLHCSLMRAIICTLWSGGILMINTVNITGIANRGSGSL